MMKIVQILGGLGNQMFQYAFAVVLKQKFGGDVLIDTTTFKTYPLHNGFELDNVFNLSLKAADKKQVAKLYHWFTGNYNIVRIYRHLLPKKKNEFREIEAQPFNPDIFNNDGNNYYSGYWQDYRYYVDYKQQIKKELSFKQPPTGKNKDYYNLFSTDNYVSVHIRRGDYMSDKGFGGICNTEYYKNAIVYIKEKMGNVKFAFFSNDFEYVKQEIAPLCGTDSIFVDWNRGNDSYNDIRLMSACRTNILANSSFSWWSGFLNIHTNPIVVAPKKWHNYQECKRQMPEWILL